MRHPWVNIALLILLVAQLLTGFFGLISGAPAFAWVLWLHGIIGYSILVIFLWKGQIILDVVRRRRLDLTRAAFLFFTLLTLVILATGLIWSETGPHYVSGFSLITIHAVLALLLLALLAWHTVARRFILSVTRAKDRRAFLRLAAISVGGLVLWQAGRSAKALLALPGAFRRFSGSYETGSLTGTFPVVSWLLDRPDLVDAGAWRLVVDGAVRQPVALAYAQVLEAHTSSLTAVIDCTGGWYSMQEWSGVSLGELLDLAGPQPGTQSVTIQSITGYARRFPLAEARALVLATHVSGQPLDHGHGFPLRLVAPGHRGYDWVKWVTRIQVNESGYLLQSPLPLQ
jgi:DMSO/TMAO reductase YedYZ molybdopterin-dependent catalytic subunit